MRTRLTLGLLLVANTMVSGCLLWSSWQTSLALEAEDDTNPAARSAGPTGLTTAIPPPPDGPRRLARAEGRLPRESELPALTHGVRDLAQRAGAKLARIDYRVEREPAAPYDTLELTLVAHGTYRAVKSVVWGLEASETPFVVRSLSVVGNASRDERLPGVLLTARTHLFAERPGGAAHPAAR